MHTVCSLAACCWCPCPCPVNATKVSAESLRMKQPFATRHASAVTTAMQPATSIRAGQSLRYFAFVLRPCVAVSKSRAVSSIARKPVCCSLPFSCGCVGGRSSLHWRMDHSHEKVCTRRQPAAVVAILKAEDAKKRASAFPGRSLVAGFATSRNS